VDSSDRFGRCLQRNDQPIAEPLVIAPRVMVLNKFADRFAQRVFTNQSILVPGQDRSRPAISPE